jgi:hypothetical protein
MDFKIKTTLCFAESSNALQNRQITIRECIQNHLQHVLGVRHHSDDSDSDLTPLVTTDPVAGAFKMWILDSNVRPLKQHG